MDDGVEPLVGRGSTKYREQIVPPLVDLIRVITRRGAVGVTLYRSLDGGERCVGSLVLGCYRNGALVYVARVGAGLLLGVARSLYTEINRFRAGNPQLPNR